MKSFITLSIVSIILLAPFFWMLLGSFKTQAETMAIPLKWFPNAFNLDNYKDIFVNKHFAQYYLNSLIVAIGITIPQLFFSALAAYAFARLDFPGKNIIFIVLMAALMVPLQMIILPRYVMMIKFGWIDKLTGIIVPSIPSIFATFFIRQHMMSLPKELDESAYLDGCSFFKTFWKIILPLSKSTLIAMAILTVTFAWNDLLWPLLVINSPEKFTLPMGVANLRGQVTTPLNLLLTGATVATIPIVLICVFFQRYFLDGIATSGLKD